MRHTFFLFGEAEKGDFCLPCVCRSLSQLVDTFGNPPGESLGIMYAIQALLFERELIFFRVREEGFSSQDYFKGIRILEKKEVIPSVSAICIPGVGDGDVIEAISEVCHLHKSCLIVNEKDLYDYLTGR